MIPAPAAAASMQLLPLHAVLRVEPAVALPANLAEQDCKSRAARLLQALQVAASSACTVAAAYQVIDSCHLLLCSEWGSLTHVCCCCSSLSSPGSSQQQQQQVGNTYVLLSRDIDATVQDGLAEQVRSNGRVCCLNCCTPTLRSVGIQLQAPKT